MDRIWGMVTGCVFSLAGLFLILEIVQGHSIAAILARTSIVILVAGGAMFLILLGLQPFLVSPPKPTVAPLKIPGGRGEVR